MGLLRTFLSSFRPFRVVLICNANRTRSPYAAARLSAVVESTVERAGKNTRRNNNAARKIEIISAGVHAVVGEPPHPLMARVARERGLKLRNWQAVPFDVFLEKEADLVLTMDSEQRDTLIRRFPKLKNRVVRLTDFGLEEESVNGGGDIQDPTMLGIEDHRRIADILDRELERIAPLLLARANQSGG